MEPIKPRMISRPTVLPTDRIALLAIAVAMLSLRPEPEKIELRNDGLLSAAG